MGLTLQHLHFTSLDGRSLRDGTLITTANQFIDESTEFDVDRLARDIDASIATLSGTFGVTDRTEIGFAAPLITLRVNGSRVNTYRGETFTQARASATAVGLADFVVRTKYLLYDDGEIVAAAVDFRLPTGREEDLLGAGSASLKLSAVGSFDGRRFSRHLNGGYTLGEVARELSYGGAIALAATDRLTASGELIGRWLDGVGGITTVSALHPRLVGVKTLRLLTDTAAAILVSFVPGVKWILGETWVLAANVRLPLTHAGLTSPITPFVGLDYAFGR